MLFALLFTPSDCAYPGINWVMTLPCWQPSPINERCTVMHVRPWNRNVDRVVSAGDMEKSITEMACVPLTGTSISRIVYHRFNVHGVQQQTEDGDQRGVHPHTRAERNPPTILWLNTACILLH